MITTRESARADLLQEMLMKRTTWLMGVMSAGIVVGCGGTSRAPEYAAKDPASVPSAGPAPVFSCAEGGQRPPSKLLLHPIDGLAGRYIVVLLDSVPDVQATANRLAQKYGGRILAIYTAALRGFAVAIDDAMASTLAEETDVCWAEQDSIVRGA